MIFEPSPVLLTHLVPQLLISLSSPSSYAIDSYTSLIDLALHTISSSWDVSLRSQFITGHPRIGQVKNLSKLSAGEQARVAAPLEVISRLEHLNRCYEWKYPGLRYITFVNGRSRTQIMLEMEKFLGLRALEDGGAVDEPKVETIQILSAESDEWKMELDRAIRDIGLIAKSRLVTFGIN
jgi:OHCU decarboxylase